MRVKLIFWVCVLLLILPIAYSFEGCDASTTCTESCSDVFLYKPDATFSAWSLGRAPFPLDYDPPYDPGGEYCYSYFNNGYDAILYANDGGYAVYMTYSAPDLVTYPSLYVSCPAWFMTWDYPPSPVTPADCDDYFGIASGIFDFNHPFFSCIDWDEDGFGSPGSPSCFNGAITDCDDFNADTYPRASEVCDGLDNQCVVDEDGYGMIDEGFGDAYGPWINNPSFGNDYPPESVDTCTLPEPWQNYWTGEIFWTDATYPFICPEGSTMTCIDYQVFWYDDIWAIPSHMAQYRTVDCGECIVCSDNDGDGYGSPGDANCPNGPETDCDDGNPAINPGATEDCTQFLDQDCDGLNAGLDPDCNCDETYPFYQDLDNDKYGNATLRGDVCVRLS
ncbi:putative metal-binding motif-containing protein [Candidatus Woesearchaeota archaeon]|nr:putative metal-binding motif-containing protein [Candidatus Woesearchaeota archaeon]